MSADFKRSRGVALVIRRKYRNFEKLRELKKQVTEVASLEIKHKSIYYLITKEHYKQKPEYQNLYQSLLNLKKICMERQITQLACPRLGCGRNEIEWETVRSIMLHLQKLYYHDNHCNPNTADKKRTITGH